MGRVEGEGLGQLHQSFLTWVDSWCSNVSGCPVNGCWMAPSDLGKLDGVGPPALDLEMD